MVKQKRRPENQGGATHLLVPPNCVPLNRDASRSVRDLCIAEGRLGDRWMKQKTPLRISERRDSPVEASQRCAG